MALLHRLMITRIIKGVILATPILFVVLMGRYEAIKGFVFVVDMSASVAPTAQLYFNRGNGFNKSASVFVLGEASAKPKTLRFPLDSGRYSEFQLFPNHSGGTFNISKIRVDDAQGHTIAQVALDDIESLTQGANIERRDGHLVVNVPDNSNNAHVGIKIRKPLVLADILSTRRLLEFATIAFAIVAACIAVVIIGEKTGPSNRLIRAVAIAMLGAGILAHVTGVVNFWPYETLRHGTFEVKSLERRPTLPGYSAPIPVKADIGRVSFFDIQFDGMATDDYFDNFFQTDNQLGFRFELQKPNQLYFVIGQRIFLLDDKFELNRWHHFHIKTEHGSFVAVEIDGTEKFFSVEQFSDFQFRSIVVGSGFSQFRPLRGAIKNFVFDVEYFRAPYRYILMRATSIFVGLLLGFFVLNGLMRLKARLLEPALVLFRRHFRGLSYYWGLIRYSISCALVSRDIAIQKLQISRRLRAYFSAIASYLFFFGIINWAINSFAFRAAVKMFSITLHRMAEPSYNVHLVTYIVIVLFFIGVLAFVWLRQAVAKTDDYIQEIPWPDPRLSVCVVVATLLIEPGQMIVLSYVFFGGALLFLIPLMVARLKSRSIDLGEFANQRRHTLPHAFGRLESPSTDSGELANQRRHTSRHTWSMGPIVFLLVLAAVSVGALAWYPIRIPNDYYELEESTRVYIPSFHHEVVLGRDEAVDCLFPRPNTESAKVPFSLEDSNAKNVSAESFARELWEKHDRTQWTYSERAHACNYLRSQLPKYSLVSLATSMQVTHLWSGQAGRTFFHHAYLFVPARHFLEYGVTLNIPAVYGVGNTLFHAILLKMWSPTYTTYFNTFPLIQLVGLLAIASLVFYISKSGFAAITGFALALAALYSMNSGLFNIIRLAPGFSPLRYFGVCLQIASIFFVFRNRSPWRWVAIPAATAVSFLWNQEFSVLGSAGQTIALLSPQHPVRFPFRISMILITAILPFALLILLGGYSSDLITTVQYGFFNIAVPQQTNSDFVKFTVGACIFIGALATLALRFSPTERDARLSLLVVLALFAIKYLYNPVAPHLFYVFVIVAPLVTCYFVWDTSTRYSRQVSIKRWGVRACMGALLVCIAQGVAFFREAQAFDNLFILPFVSRSWEKLGETLTMTIPADPIYERIMTVRSQIQPKDKVLLLSPFDHLIASYVNPPGYCGHFDLISNLITTRDAETIINCFRRSPDVLIIYDKALAIGCDVEKGFSRNNNSCGGKVILKASLQELMTKLLPEMAVVEETDTLMLYRKRR